MREGLIDGAASTAVDPAVDGAIALVAGDTLVIAAGTQRQVSTESDALFVVTGRVGSGDARLRGR